MKLFDLVRKIDGIARCTALTLGIYIGSLIAIEGYASLGSEKINTANLDRIVREERAKLGISDDISIKVTLSTTGSKCQKSSDQSYDVELSDQPYRSTLKHELYHIANGHCDSLFEDYRTGHNNPYRLMARYLFCHEPQAALYEAFGLRL